MNFQASDALLTSRVQGEIMGYEYNDELEDEELIKEIKSAKKKQKDFAEVINKKKLNKYELDEVML